MKPIKVIRVQLVTDEMRLSAKFSDGVRKIDSDIAAGSKWNAKESIKALMQKLLRKPSEQTVEYLLEMHRRWGHLVDILKYLEAHLEPWATCKDYFEIVWYKFSSRPMNAEFIQLVYSAVEDIPLNEPALAKKYLKMVIRMIDEFEADRELRNELLRILGLKYKHVLDVAQFCCELSALRILSIRPRSPQERQTFLRACGVSLDPPDD